LSYNRANRAVAILCNHQRAVPKTHEKSMGNLKAKIDAKKELIAETKRELKEAQRSRDSSTTEKKKKQL
jgi:DNA topoisomerase-1